MDYVHAKRDAVEPTALPGAGLHLDAKSDVSPSRRRARARKVDYLGRLLVLGRALASGTHKVHGAPHANALFYMRTVLEHLLVVVTRAVCSRLLRKCTPDKAVSYTHL